MNVCSSKVRGIVCLVICYVTGIIPVFSSSNRERPSVSTEIDCFVLSNTDMPGETGTRFEELAQYLARETGFSVSFTFIPGEDIWRSGDPGEAYFEAFAREIESDDPPDIIIDNGPARVAMNPRFGSIDTGLLHDVVELSKKAAATVHAYVSAFEIPWVEDKAVILPWSEPHYRATSVSLVKRSAWEAAGSPPLHTFSDLLTFLDEAKRLGLYEQPGLLVAGISYSLYLSAGPYPVGGIPLSGLYRDQLGTKAKTIFDSYPEELAHAVRRRTEVEDSRIIRLDREYAADSKAMWLDDDWAATQIVVGLPNTCDLGEYIDRYGFEDIIPFRIEWVQNDSRTMLRDTTRGMFFPANADHSREAMVLIELLADRNLTNAIYYGVPDLHHRKTGYDEYRLLVPEEPLRYTLQNPYLSLCITRPYLWFTEDIPESVREVARYERSRPVRYVTDPLEGFVFDPEPVWEIYDRYRSEYRNAYMDLVNGRGELFHVRYEAFKEKAERDYETLRTEVQRQIDAYLLKTANAN